MLHWICDQKAISVCGDLITQPGLLHEFCEDIIDVDSFDSLKQYFTADTWMAVVQRG